jgi:hypothetical protein
VTCINCVLSHDCRYVSGAEDLYHALLQERNAGRSLSEIYDLLPKVKEELRKAYGITTDFDLVVDICQCQHYEPAGQDERRL